MMHPDDFEDLVDQKIRQHEWRVAIVSSILGGILFAGVFHALYLNHLAHLGWICSGRYLLAKSSRFGIPLIARPEGPGSYLTTDHLG